MAEALASRDKKRSWGLFHELLDSGFSAEEIIHTLFWQVKTMLSNYVSKNATDAGVKPFVYSKTKKYINKYSIEDLKKLSKSMVDA